MVLFVDGPSQSRTRVQRIISWLSITFPNVQIVTGYIFDSIALSKTKLRNLVRTAQSVDAAIFVTAPDGGKKTIRSDEEEWKTIIFECGMLMGVVSHNNVCVIGNSIDDSTPSFFDSVNKLIVSDTQDIIKWVNTIRPMSPKIISKPKGTHLIPWDEAFSYIFNHQKEFDNVRVFALSTLNSPGLMIKSDIKIKKATLLLREFSIVDEFLQLSAEKNIDLSIELWERMYERKIINDLDIIRFDFHPTSEMFIFDNQFIVLADLYFDIKKGEYSFDREEVFLFDSSSDLGEQFIDKCISHFDKLAEIYSNYNE